MVEERLHITDLACWHVQVIPRLNPCFFPDASYISQDRQRLLLRLDMYALQERPVVGDGNCQVGAHLRQGQATATAELSNGRSSIL